MKTTFSIIVLALLAASVLADNAQPGDYIWTAKFKGDECDWSQAVSVVADQPTTACVETPCSAAGGFSSLVHCGPDFPAAKASPPGSLVVQFADQMCSGTALKKTWSNGGCFDLSKGIDVRSVSTTCNGNSYETTTYSITKDCSGAGVTTSMGTGCFSNTRYYCGLKASPASTLVASALIALVALALAL